MEEVVCGQKYSINLLLIRPSSGRVLRVKTVHWLTRTSVQPPPCPSSLPAAETLAFAWKSLWEKKEAEISN